MLFGAIPDCRTCHWRKISFSHTWASSLSLCIVFLLMETQSELMWMHLWLRKPKPRNKKIKAEWQHYLIVPSPACRRRVLLQERFPCSWNGNSGNIKKLIHFYNLHQDFMLKTSIYFYARKKNVFLHYSTTVPAIFSKTQTYQEKIERKRGKIRHQVTGVLLYLCPFIQYRIIFHFKDILEFGKEGTLG